jgi:hypothetical protein
VIDDLYENLAHYLILLVLLGGGLVLFFFFSYSPQIQLYLSLATALFYLLWGVSHHYLNKDLSWSVVIEYTLVAVLAWTIIYTVLGQT